MSLVSLLVLVFVAALANSSSAEPRRLSLQLIDRSRLHPEVLQELSREVEEAWRDELRLEWTSAPVDPSDPRRPERLYIFIAGPRTTTVRPGVIAAIVFLATGPRNQIRVYRGEAERLLSADPSCRYMQLPVRIRNQALGRVLGRAIAHEIGHYVRNSTGHSSSGLMRARHPIALMAGVERWAFHPGPALVTEDCSLNILP
jgi:hypothetical protein